MKTALDRRRRRFIHYFIGIPLAIIFIVVNIVLISWLFYVLYTSFAKDLDHMSLSQWAEHFYTIIKDIVDPILKKIIY